MLLINAAFTILFLSETSAGSTHNKRNADATLYPLPAGSGLIQDLGFLAFPLEQVKIILPTRKPPIGAPYVAMCTSSMLTQVATYKQSRL